MTPPDFTAGAGATQQTRRLHLDIVRDGDGTHLAILSDDAIPGRKFPGSGKTERVAEARAMQNYISRG